MKEQKTPEKQMRPMRRNHSERRTREVCDLFEAAQARFNATGAGFDYYSYAPGGGFRLRLDKLAKPRKTARAFCGATCRNGEPCRARVVVRADGTLARRCRNHGGLSTGAKTAEGRARIAESNRRRAKP